ncbi:hypothetical protein TNCV_4762311 [Trichonephila clavipes]|nr:hypothetical protein TNCV_4762311 [Trichonephila clavipes]
MSSNLDTDCWEGYGRSHFVWIITGPMIGALGGQNNPERNPWEAGGSAGSSFFDGQECHRYLCSERDSNSTTILFWSSDLPPTIFLKAPPFQPELPTTRNISGTFDTEPVYFVLIYNGVS